MEGLFQHPFLRGTILIVLIVVAFTQRSFARQPPGTANVLVNATIAGSTNLVCVRAIIKKSDGTYVLGEWQNPSGDPVVINGKALGPTNMVQVPTGTTQITIGKGPDHFPQTITTNLSTAGQTYVIKVALQPVFNLLARGWRGGDMHMHYYHGEGEIFRSPQEVFTITAAGGMNFAMLCEEHYGADSLTRQGMLDAWKPFENSECKIWDGVEEPKNAWGHHANIVYDPWSIRSALPYHWGMYSVHQQGGVTFPVHPERYYPDRSYTDQTGTHYVLYPFNNHNKAYPLDALIGHLFDGWSGVSDDANIPRILPPYFKLLDMGYRIPLLADSDFCFDRTNNAFNPPGSFMTYYNIGTNEPLLRASIANAMRKGRVMATTGPLVLFTIDNAVSGDTLPADGASHTVHIDASYTFNAWTLSKTNFAGTDICRISEISLFRNGQILQTWTPNTSTASVQRVISETVPGSYYMVRVVGNDTQWAAGYASPIYFDSAARPTHPPVFKSLVQGRVYNATNGATVSANVSCIRYGRTNWTIATDAQGRFRAYVPLDAQLTARDSAGREFTQDILKNEQVYSLCHYMADNYFQDKAASVDALSNIVRTLNWEFPTGYQLAGSYVRTQLNGSGVMTNFSVTSAPAQTPGKSTPEIVMALLDKTRAQPGDTINYAVIFRQAATPNAADILGVEWKGWDANKPTMFNKYSRSFYLSEDAASLINIGGGFLLRQGSVVVPAWVTNVTDTTGAMEMWIPVRRNGLVEEARLIIPVGPTKRELLVSSTWDGFPANWDELGTGPCNFYRNFSFFDVRYADYRNTTVQLSLNGQPLTISPAQNTAHVADADDASFHEPFFYDGSCEPQFRNIAFRDVVRAQPAPTDFSGVPIQNPPDTTPPIVVATEPRSGEQVNGNNVPFYYYVDDAGDSGGATNVTILIDGQAVTNTGGNPVWLNLNGGVHTWQVVGSDLAGNQAVSGTNLITIVGITNPIVKLSIARMTNSVLISWPTNALPFVLQQTFNLENPSWSAVTNQTLVVSNQNQVLVAATNSRTFYRLSY